MLVKLNGNILPIEPEKVDDLFEVILVTKEVELIEVLVRKNQLEYINQAIAKVIKKGGEAYDCTFKILAVITQVNDLEFIIAKDVSLA